MSQKSLPISNGELTIAGLMNFVPLGDQAVLVYCRDEQEALNFAARARASGAEWIIDVVQAYQSVAVFYSLDAIDYGSAAEALKTFPNLEASHGGAGQTFEVPCCYEMGLDLERIATHTGLKAEEIIRLHAETVYTVYAIGFCPGFPYLGYLPDELSGVPRLETPRVRVEPGSVGLTGRQTGIYTELRPGGWNIVGRTPLELVNVADGYFPLRTGDQVRFVRINEKEYAKLKGNRLSG